MTSGANCFYQPPQLYLLRTSGSAYVINKKGGERGIGTTFGVGSSVFQLLAMCGM
jgi:hypothetical protein